MSRDNYLERIAERVKEVREKPIDGDPERKHKWYMKNRDRILDKRKEAKMEYKISKESADKVFSRNIITHIPFNHNNISELHDYGGSTQKTFMAQVADTSNKVICEAIIRYADEQGATDLFLIDEEFIKSAIINEIQRRKELIK